LMSWIAQAPRLTAAGWRLNTNGGRRLVA